MPATNPDRIDDPILREILGDSQGNDGYSLKKLNRLDRPISITIIAIISVLIGVYHFLTNLLFINPMSTGLGIAFLVAAYGLIELKPWGGFFAIGIYIIALYPVWLIMTLFMSIPSSGYPEIEALKMYIAIISIIEIVILGGMAFFVYKRLNKFSKGKTDYGKLIDRFSGRRY